MSKRSWRNLLQILLVMLLATSNLAFSMPASADGPSDLRAEAALVSGGLDDTTVAAGTTVRIGLAAWNDSPDGLDAEGDAEDVGMYLYLPEGFEIVPGPDSPTNGAVMTQIGPRAYYFALGDIVAGGSFGFGVAVAIAPDAVAGSDGHLPVALTAAVDPGGPTFYDVNTENNTYAVNLTVVEDAQDVWVDQTRLPGSAFAGAPNDYVLGVFNGGPSAARQVTLVDELSPDETYVSVDFTKGSGECSYLASSHTLLCRLGTVMPSTFIEGAEAYDPTVEMVLHTEVKSSTADVATITNSATVGWLHWVGPGPDDEETFAAEPDLFDTWVDRDVSLQVSKVSSPNPLTAGERLTYDITVTNNGPSDADGVELTEALPSGVSFVAASLGSDWAETVPGSAYALTRPLAAGETVGLSLEADTTANLYGQLSPGTPVITNSVCVTSNEMMNDSQVCADQDTLVTEAADLAVFKVSSSGGQLYAGQELEYTIHVYNRGPSAARGVKVVDDIISAAGVSVLDWAVDAPTPSTVTEIGGQLEIAINRIPAGQRAEITVLIGAEEATSVTNVVNASANTPDPDVTNNTASTTDEFVASADLGIYTDADPVIITAGSVGRFLIEVYNDGPSTANNVVVKNRLPQGVELLSVDAGGGLGLIGGNALGDANDPVVVPLGDLAPGEYAWIDILVMVDPNYTDALTYDFLGYVINSAEVSSDTFDPFNGNNADSAHALVLGEADLALTKGQTPDPVVAGEMVEWPMVITNYGPSVARDVQLLDALPGELGFEEVVLVSGEAQCQYSHTTGLLGCDLGDMYPGDSVSLIARTHVKPHVSDGTVIENTATVGSRLLLEPIDGYPGTRDDNFDNNVSSDSGTVRVQSWVNVTIEATPDPVLAGQKIHYLVTVTNDGPSIASGAAVNVGLPAMVDYSAYSGPEWTLDAPLSWSTERILFPGESSSFMVEGIVRSETTAWDWEAPEPAVDPAGSETLAVGACAQWNEAPLFEDPDLGLVPSESCTSLETFADEEADLYIVKVGSPEGQVPAGGQIEYIVYVYNLGPSDARNVVVTDNVLGADYLETVDLQVIEGGGSVNSIAGVAIQGETVVLPAGQRFGYRVVLSSDEAVDLQNIAHVSSDTPDPDWSNNDAATFHEFVAMADLSITKSQAGGMIHMGEEIVWNIEVYNSGPSVAQDVVIYDALPAGVSPAPGPWSPGTPGDPNDPMTIPLGNLNPGETRAVQVVVRVAPDLATGGGYIGVPSIAEIWNTARVDSVTVDPKTANNTSSAWTPLMSVADLRAQIQPNPINAVAGESFEFLLSVDNAGPSAAIDSTVYLNWAPLAQVESITPVEGTWDCASTLTSGMMQCNLGDLGPQQASVALVRMRLQADLPDGMWLPVQAYVTSSWSADFNGYNNMASAIVSVSRMTNLTVTRETWPEPVVAGDKLYHSITVTNEGPSMSSGIEVTHNWDMANLELLGQTGSEWVMTEPDTWLLNRWLMPGDTSTFVLEFRVKPSTANVTGSYVLNSSTCVTDDVMPGEVCPPIEQTFVDEQADLRLIKVGTPNQTVRAGEELQYAIFVYNLGLSDARNVVVTDEILSNGQFSDPVFASQGYDCTVDGGEIVCDVAVHPAGQRETIWITVTANEEVAVNNLSCVASDTPDPDADNNCAMVLTSVVPVADLSVHKTPLDQGPWIAGTEAGFRIEVTNNGPSTAENVVIEDFLPAYVTVLETVPAGNYTAGVPGDPNAPMVIPVGSLEAGQTWEVEVYLQIDAGYPFDPALNGEFLTNDVRVSSDVFDPDISSNHNSAVLLVEPFSQLIVSKSATPGEAMAGEPLEYAITVMNAGPSVAHGVTVIDSFDDEMLTFVDYEVGLGEGRCFYDATHQEVLCDLGDIEPNTVREIYLTFLVSPDAPDGYLLWNQADLMTVSSVEFEGANVEVPVINNADLQVTKSADKMQVYAGQQLTYTIDVVNHGPTSAVGVQVVDTLPGGVTYVNDNLGSCSLEDAELTCDLGDLPVGQSVSFDVLVTVNADTIEPIINVASVSSDTVDLDSDNNESAVTTPVDGFADLRAIKFGKPEAFVRAGEELTYTILVDNLGTGVAHGVKLVDSLDSNGVFELQSVESSLPVVEDLASLQQQFTKSGSFTLTLADDLPITLGQAPWRITTIVMANDDQTINNCVVVSGDDFDPDVENNRACAEHDITNVADLGVDKTAVGESQIMGEPAGTVELTEGRVTAGQALFYSITVTNSGPSIAENVVVHDDLPVGVEFVEADPAADTSQLPGKLIWNLGSLASGDVVEIEVKVLVPAHVPQSTVLRNTAAVMSDIFDQNNSNNTASAEAIVEAYADIVLTKWSEPETAIFGNDIEYHIVVENLGPSDAGLVRISDLLPEGIDGEKWEYTTDGGLTFTRGYGNVNVTLDMPVGQVVQMGVTGIVNTYATFTNTACASSREVVDPVADNNCDQVENRQTLVFYPIEMRGTTNTSHRADITVSKIVATPSYVEVTVTNVGNRPLLEPFWVDFYVSPDPVPTAVNQIWENLCAPGMGWAWRVTGDDGLPLDPGESLVLVVDDTDSDLFPLAQGLTVWAQADSWNPNSEWGMVLEQDEIQGLPYNNIRWSTVGRVWGYDGIARTSDDVIRSGALSSAAADGLPPRP